MKEEGTFGPAPVPGAWLLDARPRGDGSGGEPGPVGPNVNTATPQSNLSANFPPVDHEPEEPAGADLAEFMEAWKHELEAKPDDDGAGPAVGRRDSESKRRVAGAQPDRDPAAQPDDDRAPPLDVAGYGQAPGSLDPSNVVPGYAERVEEQSAKLALALQLQLQAERTEAEGGRMHEAMMLYRKASRLDPNVGHRAYQFHEDAEAKDPTPIRQAQAPADAAPGAFDNVSMAAHLETVAPQWEPRSDTSTKPIPFGTLPQELLAQILMMVVQMGAMDITPIVKLSEVCRAAYLAAHDEDCWRRVGRLLWGELLHSPPDRFDSFRQMCIQRPRLLCHGVYISAYKYHRIGEQDMTIGQYTPHHTVEYYRYLRFFPDGSVIAVTSAEHPAVMVPRLKHPKNLAVSEKMYYTGTCALEDDLVMVVASKQGTPSAAGGRTVITMRISLQIQRRKMVFSGKLGWKDFASHTVRDRGTIKANFDLVNYLPFTFSRVKSMAAGM